MVSARAVADAPVAKFERDMLWRDTHDSELGPRACIASLGIPFVTSLPFSCAGCDQYTLLSVAISHVPRKAKRASFRRVSTADECATLTLCPRHCTASLPTQVARRCTSRSSTPGSDHYDIQCTSQVAFRC